MQAHSPVLDLGHKRLSGGTNDKLDKAAQDPVVDKQRSTTATSTRRAVCQLLQFRVDLVEKRWNQRRRELVL